MVIADVVTCVVEVLGGAFVVVMTVLVAAVEEAVVLSAVLTAVVSVNERSNGNSNLDKPNCA